MAIKRRRWNQQRHDKERNKRGYIEVDPSTEGSEQDSTHTSIVQEKR